MSTLRSICRRPCVDHESLRNPVELWLAAGRRFNKMRRRRISTRVEVMPRRRAGIEALNLEAGGDLMLPRSLPRRLVNHARLFYATEGYAADWTVEQLREPAQRIADRIDALWTSRGMALCRNPFDPLRKVRGR